MTVTDWLAITVVGLSALLFYTTLWAWRPRRLVVTQQQTAERLRSWGMWPYRAAGGWAVWVLLWLMGLAALAWIWIKGSEPIAIKPILVRVLPLSLAHEVVVIAERDGLPAHLALELAQSESRIRHVDRIEGRQWDCGVMQVAAPLATGCVLSEWEEIEVGVGMAANWWRIAGGRLGDWPRARQAYRTGHLPKRSER